MDNKCEYFDSCKQATKYHKGLEGENKKELNYFLTVCLNRGDENCINKQKSLDKKLEGSLNE